MASGFSDPSKPRLQFFGVTGSQAGPRLPIGRRQVLQRELNDQRDGLYAWRLPCSKKSLDGGNQGRTAPCGIPSSVLIAGTSTEPALGGRICALADGQDGVV